ncbi:DinB family protein [Halobacillus litoralis]|uniref:DinB family protein n=1 Tax=Halobacillus litoralis TaxID=45668 RepID=UPI001CFC58A9|nr:DinB family protein [Halobacillus litoralis]WLR47899.1 DinB family protein [Halobacillus litoralis]
MALREVLLEQLRSVHDENSWFVCFNYAVRELEEPQAVEKLDDRSHSIAEIVHHLYFYNERYLSRFRGEEVMERPRHYDTFQNHGQMQWHSRVADYQMVLTMFRQELLSCSQEKLEMWAETLSNLFMHNAYHIGQIVTIRKRNGWWGINPVVKG